MKSNLGILSSNINSLEFLTLNGLNDYFNFYAVASRNIEDSQAFSSDFNFKKKSYFKINLVYSNSNQNFKTENYELYNCNILYFKYKN